MTDGLSRGLIIPDLHSPYHDKRAWRLLMKVVEHVPFEWVVILGDFGDFYSVSSHTKDPGRRVKLKQEVKVTNALLREIEARITGRRVFIKGNHENRYERLIAEKVPELHGITSVDDMLKLTENKWEVVEYKDHTTVGRVYLTHDTGKAGNTAVKAALDDFQDNVVIGHLHRFEARIEGNAKGVPHLAACLGWLGDVDKVDYMHKIKAKRTWALGFGVAYHRKSNDWVYLFPTPIVGYTCVVEGKLYRA